MDPSPSPSFVTFEGIDGSGKSTQLRLLQRHLAQAKRAPLLVREPGGTELSERVRQLLLDPALAIDAMAELLLFSAARAQLVREVIAPALDQGRLVLADRFYDSSTAYQGAGRGVAAPDWLQDFHRHVTGGLTPERTYLIDVPPAVAAGRRGRRTDRMEQAGAAFFERVRSAYLHIAEAEPERVLVLDGLRTVAEVHAEIVADLHRLGAFETPASAAS